MGTNDVSVNVSEVLVKPVRWLVEHGMAVATKRAELENRVEVRELYEDPWNGIRQMAVVQGGLEYSPVTLKMREARRYELNSLASLVAFLKRDEWAGKQVVAMLSLDSVDVDLDFAAPGLRDTAVMEIDRSSEFNALLAVSKGMGLKALHLALRTQLWGCFSPALLLQLGGIKVSQSAEDETKIGLTGLAQETKGGKLLVQFATNAGTMDAELATEWEWTGRPFECWDRKVTLTCALDLAVEGGKLVIRLLPRQIEQVIGEYLDEMAAELGSQLPANVCVYSGEWKND